MRFRDTWTLLIGLAVLSGCAEGSGDSGTGAGTTTSQGGGGEGAGTTTSQGGGGEGGGGTTTDGGGGAGGATSSTTTSSSTTTTTTYVDPGHRVILLAGGPDAIVAGQYLVGGSWQTTSFDAGTNDPVSLTPIWGPQPWSVGAFRSSEDGRPYSILWTAGAFSGPEPINSEPTLGGPSVLTESTYIYAAVQKADGTFATSHRQGPGGGWTFWSTVKHIDNGQPVFAQGPSAPYIGWLEGARAIGFTGDDGDMYYQLAVTNQSWQKPYGLGVPGPAAGRPAFAESLLQGMIAWTQASGQIMWTEYITFFDPPPPSSIAGAVTTHPIALAYSPSKPSSQFLIAFRGLDGMLYLTRTIGAQWTPPELLFGGVQITGSPALGIGYQGSDEWAELAFISADQGDVYHSRLVSGTWTAPEKVVGPGFQTVAIQAAPF